MTLRQAKKLYTTVATRINGRCEDYSDGEWFQIASEMRAVVDASSERVAAKVIRWWGCWDRKHTCIEFARALRAEWGKTSGK